MRYVFFLIIFLTGRPTHNEFTRTKALTIRLFLSLSASLQRQNGENLKQIFPEKEYLGLNPNFHIHVSVSELYIPTMGLPFLLEEICGLILGIYKSSQTHEFGNWG
jgi:hypothetical protein